MALWLPLISRTHGSISTIWIKYTQGPFPAPSSVKEVASGSSNWSRLIGLFRVITEALDPYVSMSSIWLWRAFLAVATLLTFGSFLFQLGQRVAALWSSPSTDERVPLPFTAKDLIGARSDLRESPEELERRRKLLAASSSSSVIGSSISS